MEAPLRTLLDWRIANKAITHTATRNIILIGIQHRHKFVLRAMRTHVRQR